MTKPRLSLGIPVYNQADTIEETVLSVLNQKEPFDEIVVVENHSTDGTADKLLLFGNRIKVVRPPSHNGIAQNWNFCVDNLSSPWFSLLSGDDVLKPDFVTRVKAAIASHHNVALIRTDWDLIDGAGSLRGVHRQRSVARITNPPHTWKEQLYGPKVSFAAFAARKDLWTQVGGFPLDFHLFHDWMFWMKLAPFGTFVRIPEPLAQYRIQERPVIDSGRVAPRIFDEFHYVMDVLPLLPWQSADTSAQIKHVRARKLRELLSFLSRYPDVVERADCRAKLDAWAAAAEMGEAYQAWLVHRQPFRAGLPQRAAVTIKKLIKSALERSPRGGK